MWKFSKPFTFLAVIVLLLDGSVIARNHSLDFDVNGQIMNSSLSHLFSPFVIDSDFIFTKELLACPTPAVSSPLYYCLNSVAVPLKATALAGNSLIWYGTSSTLGIPSATAPTPATNVAGTTTYYVSQSDGICESARAAIVVNIVVDNGATILGLTCDPSQILAADRNSSVYFDWSNNPLISNNYNYSYTIQGGSPVSGMVSVSHLQVFGMLPGQSATLILTSATHPCVPSRTLTCSLACVTNTSPTFATIPLSYCINDVPPVLPTSSTNVPIITGTWNPSIITTATSGTVNYVFTPNPVTFPCATTKTLSITVNSLKEPNFVDLNVCSGGIMPPLNTRSPNGISGTWTPSSINNVSSGTYDFTPNPNQCATPKKTINVTVSPSATLVNVNWTVTDAFVTNQILTVSASGTGNYLYQLDSGPFQENPVFENVAFGTHSITVKDLYGCSASITIKDVLVINYPKYFTPNGDGFNDTWNIFTLKDQLNSRIYIFDRYGKLMKDLSTQSFGWDGMYNGQPVPADDYWFSVEYVEQDISKKFKSHFSLKR